MNNLRLIKPTLDFAEPYLAMEMEELSCDPRLIGIVPTNNEELERHIKLCEHQETQGDESTCGVPQTTYWLLCDESGIVGTCRLRHRLTQQLEIVGGHIDYGIRTSLRGKGYGTELLRLLIDKAASIGIDRLLIMCRENNYASIRVVEKNGGVFEGKSINQNLGVILRYWIDTTHR